MIHKLVLTPWPTSIFCNFISLNMLSQMYLILKHKEHWKQFSKVGKADFISYCEQICLYYEQAFTKKIHLFFCSLVNCEVATVENILLSHKYSPELNSFQSKACSFMNFTSCLYNKSSQLCHVILSPFSVTGCLKLKMGQQ